MLQKNYTNDYHYINIYRFLDVWQVGRSCCHPNHKQQDDALPLNHLVSAYQFLFQYFDLHNLSISWLKLKNRYFHMSFNRSQW